MPDDDLIIRPAEAVDTTAILALLRTSMAEGSPRTLDYWNWKHRDGTFGPSYVLVAEKDRTVVGLRAFMRWEWAAAGRVFHAVRAVDTATHPECRGRGIFTTLTEALVEQVRAAGVAFVFNTPNANSRPGFIKMGWKSLGRVSLLIRPQRPWRIMAALARRAVGGRSAAGELPARAAKDVLDHPAIVEFADRAVRTDGRLGTPRTAAYLRWRYRNVPGFTYFADGDVDGERGALVIGRLKWTGELRELRICDIVIGSDRGSRQLARRTIARLAGAAQPDYISAMAASRTDERAVLLRSGFVPAPRIGPILTVRALDAGTAPSALDRRQWRLSIGDLELL